MCTPFRPHLTAGRNVHRIEADAGLGCAFAHAFVSGCPRRGIPYSTWSCASSLVCAPVLTIRLPRLPMPTLPLSPPAVVLIAVCVAQAHGKGGGGGGGIGGAGGGGAAAYTGTSSGSAATSKAGGLWNPQTGRSTAGGSSVVPTAAGAMSTRPRYGGLATRPIYYAGAALVVMTFYRGNSVRQCTDERFQFGAGCRKCSNWECPIGQFRETCTSGSDSYCKLCTNKPGGSAETMYTSPGNSTSVNDGSGNDCAFQTCVNDVSSAQPTCPGKVSPEFEGSSQSGIPLKESDPANLVFYSEMPVDVATFIGSLSTEYKAAIAEVGTSSPTHPHNAHEIR